MKEAYVKFPIHFLTDPELKTNDKIILAYLLWRQGNNDCSWPALRTIAADLHIGLHTTQRSIERLVKCGWITVYAVGKEGGQRSNSYTVNTCKSGIFEASKRRQREFLRHANHSLFGRFLREEQARQNPSNVPKTGTIHETQCTQNGYSSVPKMGTEYTPEKIHQSINAHFSSFWDLYPRKVGKGHAEKAYRKILTQSQDLEKLAGEILEAVGEQIKAGMLRKKCRYTRYPATWLNAQGWLDEIEQFEQPEPDQQEAKLDVMELVAKGEL